MACLNASDIMRILGCSLWHLLKHLFIRLHQQGCSVFFQMKVRSCQGKSSESLRRSAPWRPSQMEMFSSVFSVLLKVPLCSSSLKFKIINNFPILHLEGYTICLKIVLMFLVEIKLSKCRMKKEVKEGSLHFIIFSYGPLHGTV